MIQVVMGSEVHREWLVNTAFKQMFEEEMKKPYLYCKEQLHSLLNKCFPEGTILVAEEEGIPIGTLCSIESPNPYNPSILTLVELVWYVVPEKREGRAGALLLKEFIKLGEGYDEVTMSLLVESSPLAPSSLEKKGFKMKEYGFVKDNHGTSN